VREETMESDKDLLQKIRTIEDECAQHLDEEEEQGKRRITEARMVAERIIETAALEGERAAKQRYDEYMERVHAEIDGLGREAANRLEQVRAAGAANEAAAMRVILRRVASG
jgi:vacuolar-type H+-ATPase subunit H